MNDVRNHQEYNRISGRLLDESNIIFDIGPETKER